MEATRIGIDVAKSWFHLVAMDSRGQVIWRKALTRRRVLETLVQLNPALVTMEACATAHYWAREIQKLGHEVKLIHPAFVMPFRKSGKNDFNDAEALCEASCRPMMRFVEVKSIAQQDIQSLHRARRLLIKQRTQLANQLRGLLAEYGIAVRRSISALRREAAELAAEPELSPSPCVWWSAALSNSCECSNNSWRNSITQSRRYAAAMNVLGAWPRSPEWAR